MAIELHTPFSMLRRVASDRRRNAPCPRHPEKFRFRTYLPKLKRLGLVDVDHDQVRASEALFS